MKYEVHKCRDGEIEFLPDLLDTPIWDDYDDYDCPPSVRLVAVLYRAVAERENYYQFNTPTAFGDPEYRFAFGRVFGIMEAAGITETRENGKMVFRKGRRVILVVDEIHLHESYYEAKRDIRKTLAAIL